MPDAFTAYLPALATLGAAGIAGFCAWRVARKNRYATASATFRKAVLHALQGLYPVPVQWPSEGNAIDQLLREVFPALQRAIAEFRPYVAPWRRRAFDRAWHRYHCSTSRSVDTQVYHHYMGFSGMEDPKVTFHANVSQVLKFAKDT
jgi:hypothetical protein